MPTSTIRRFLSVSVCGALAIGGASAHARQASQSAMQSSYAFYWAVSGPMEPQIDLSSTPIERGQYIMYYEHEFGLFPRVYSGVHYENGAIPQRANMPAHIAKLKQDIARRIPDPNFSGYVSIDYENWWPCWEKIQWNKELIAECIQYTKQRFPSLRGAALEAKAAEEFETAGRQFLVATINAAKAERPKAKWGYNGTTHHDQRTYRAKFQAVYDAVTAFYPVIYARDYSIADDRTPGKDQNEIRDYKHRINMSISYAREVAGNRPVVALIWIRYHNANPTYGFQPVNDRDLDAMFMDPPLLGANGVVFWDYVGDTQTYNVYRNYVSSKIAPRIQQVLAMFETQRSAPASTAPPPPAPEPTTSTPPPPTEPVPDLAPIEVYGQAHLDAIEASMGSRAGRPKFNPVADVDLNKRVHRRDRDLVKANWGLPVMPAGVPLEFPKKSGKKD